MAIIENGGSDGGFKAVVTRTGRLNVSARANPRIFYISRGDGQAFTWTSAFSADTGEEVIYIKNTSDTLNLYIDRITVGGLLAAVWTVFHVTGGTAAGGTITGKNLNLTSGTVAAATALGNVEVTGTLTGETLYTARSSATNSKDVDIADAIALGKNDELAITYVGSTGLIEVTVTGFYDDKTN